MTPLISVKDLRVSFQLTKTETFDAVKGISFDVPANSTVALVGESGSGKSVSAMSIVRLLPDNSIISPESQVLFNGEDLLKRPLSSMRALRGKDISVVFQEPMTSLNPVFPVGEQVAEVLRLHMGMSAAQAKVRALELLTEVGIPHPKERMRAYPHELSGGQQQRVMIAIAIACEPKLLIADEPTTALDVTVQRQIMELMAKLQEKRQMSILFISHDLGLVGEIANKVVVMRHGVIREQGGVDQIFSAAKDEYTKALIACRPNLAERPRRLPTIDDFTSGKPIEPSELKRPAATGEALVKVAGLRKVYQLKEGLFKRKNIEAVKDASFTLHRGRTLGVVGESGSGKTTIGMMLTRLTEPTAGEVMFDGTNLVLLNDKALQPYRKRIQIIFQNPYASLNPRFTVGQILMEPMRIHGIGGSENERAGMAVALIERVGLPRAAFGKYPHEFSGGQRQRIAIARCLTLKPEIIVCDESVSALDVSVQATVLNLLLDLQEEFGLAYVFISHDLAVVKYMADEILVMNQGEIVERGDADAIYNAPQHEYTKKLIGAIPKGHALAA
jgi:peptide/nickel transport system ATP-binding protein